MNSCWGRIDSVAIVTTIVTTAMIVAMTASIIVRTIVLAIARTIDPDIDRNIEANGATIATGAIDTIATTMIAAVTIVTEIGITTKSQVTQ
jgi:hypothetical protein